jgi:ATP-binding cassette subfamily B protein
MWRLCKLGYRDQPRLMLASFLVSQLAALPDALLALWLMLLGKGVMEHRPALVQGAAVGLALSTAGTWFLRTVSTRIQRRFRDKVTIALESHVAQLQGSIATIAHQERPEYLDRLSMLRNQVFVLDHMYQSLFTTLGWILRLGVTMGLLASIHPALMLLALFAIPTILTSTWRPGIERMAQERGAQTNRLSRHLFTIATTASPGKEVRVTGIGERLVQASGGRALGLGLVARAGLGHLRPGVCRRGCIRGVWPARSGKPSASGPGCRSTTVLVYRRHSR